MLVYCPVLASEHPGYCGHPGYVLSIGFGCTPTHSPGPQEVFQHGSSVRAGKRLTTEAAAYRPPPHRNPFLLVDCIIDMRGEEHGVGIKNVTMNESHFGRFPENPVMPGMLMIGGMAQTAGVLALRLMPRPSDRA
jgi:hypothetical protein